MGAMHLRSWSYKHQHYLSVSWMMLVLISSQVIFLLFLHPLAFLPACIFLLTQTASVTFPAPTLNHEAGITNQQQSPKGLSENIHSYSSFLPASPVQNIIFRASHMKLPNSEFIIKSKQHNLITLRLVSDPLLKIGGKKKKVKLLWKIQTEKKKQR